MELETLENGIGNRKMHWKMVMVTFVNQTENIGKFRWKHWLQAMQILDSVGCYIDCKIVFDIYNGSP